MILGLDGIKDRQDSIQGCQKEFCETVTKNAVELTKKQGDLQKRLDQVQTLKDKNQ